MSEINTLKRRAANLYLTLRRESDDMDCGAHLAGFIRPRLATLQTELDCVMARLREIDPECPRAKETE